MDVASQMLEYYYLAHLMAKTNNNQEYMNRLKNIEAFLNRTSTINKLPNKLIYMNTLNIDTGQWLADAKVLDANSRFYSYLIKRFIQSDSRDEHFLLMFANAIKSLERNSLFVRDTESDRMYTSNYYEYDNYYEYMKISGCQMGATLAFGARQMEIFLKKSKKIKNYQNLNYLIRKFKYQISKYWEMAEEITETCYQESIKTKTGLPPRVFYFNINKNVTNFIYTNNDNNTRKYLLTSELAESYFVLWRLTHDSRYRDYAWQLISAIYNHCSISSGGYSVTVNVDKVPQSEDLLLGNQPAEFISSTLKYIYLTFSDDDLLPLDQWVFNRFGQPLPIISTR